LSIICQLLLVHIYVCTSVNSVHNAPRLSVMGPDVHVNQALRGGWGRERSVTDRPGPIFRPLLHRPLPSPTPQNLRHRHRDLQGTGSDWKNPTQTDTTIALIYVCIPFGFQLTKPLPLELNWHLSISKK